MDELYENIRRLRKAKGLSQEELAEKTGYTDRSSIAKIEKGDVDLPQSKIQLFADVLGVTPQYLMGYTNKSENVSSSQPTEVVINVPVFTTAQEAISFILRQPLVADYGGYDLSKMSDDDIIAFANEIAGMIQYAARHRQSGEE